MSETEVKEVVDLEEQKNAANKDAEAPEATHLKNDAEDLGAPVVKPTDVNPDATKKVSKASDQVTKDANDGSLPNDQKPSAKAEEVETEEDVMSEASIDSIDLTDDVKALVSSDADLSEEFKDKAATIFEAAVKTRIKEQTKILEAQFDEKLASETETVKEAMVEKVDSYLNYVVEEWMKENEIAIERGLKGEIAEDFISGLKNLFTEHYIDVPDEKYDILGTQSTKIDELEAKLNEQIEKSASLKSEKDVLVRESVFAEVASDLADTEVEKFKSLAEDVDFADEDSFRSKLDTLKESYFPKATTVAESVDTPSEDGQSFDTTGAMSAYMSAISKNVKRAK